MLETKKNLTATELELMHIVWKLGEASVKEVLKHLPKKREMAYTSASTILRILEKKQILSSRKEGRTHYYFPLISKEDYSHEALRQMVKNVFSKTPSALAKAFLDTQDLKEEDLKEIKKLIDKKVKDYDR